jgi:hypothetical protein
MPNIELLDPRRHGTLRLRAGDAATPHFVQILTSEFSTAAAYCPIFFTKEPDTGRFFAGAMFGFRPGENLLGTVEQRGGFNPLIMLRDGFFMSGQNVAIDRDHARFSDREGEPLFDETLQPAMALRRIQRTLGDIHVGVDATNQFIAALSDLKLIEPVDIALGFENGERLQLQGLYSASMDRVRDLDDATVLKLFRAGHLQLVHLMAASLKQLARLASLRNRLNGNPAKSTGSG